ncbi:MAG: hypothetical protein M1835_000596 [Candelina submexicana]|nr:MAG: hypothetical protein M1835_000596 [Candelina submexicana]
MSYLCVHLDGERALSTPCPAQNQLSRASGIYYRCFIKYSFDKSCTYLATLAREHRSGRLDLKWYITNEKRLDPSTYEYIAEVLELPTSIWYWDKVPGETPTIHGNDGIWVHNLDLDRGYYTARTWRLPSDGAPYELDDDSEGPLVISWERPRLGDIAVSLDKFEALEDFYWNELASLPQLGAKVLPMRKYQRPSDKPLQVSQVSSSTRSVLVNLVFCVITDFASQWYALLFETILSERLTLHFVSAYLLLAVWDVDLELNMGGGSVAATSFPTWPTVGQEDQITFWYRGVIVAAVTDMENESQRSEAILRARSAYEAVYLKSKGDEMEKGFGLVISSKHLIVIEFGQKDHKVSDCHPIFTENCTNVMQVRGHCQRVFGRASVNISTIETLISVFHQASCLKQQAKEQHNRLLDLPPELRKAVFDLLDRKSFDSVAKAVPALLTEYWYHPVINDNQRIASVVEENDGFEPLRLMKLRFENEGIYRRFRRHSIPRPRDRYLLKFSGCDAGLAYLLLPEVQHAA